MKFKIIDIWETYDDPPVIMMAYKKQMCVHEEEEMRQIHFFNDYESLRVWLAMAGEADQRQEQMSMTMKSHGNCPSDLDEMIGKECDLTEFCDKYGDNLEESRRIWKEEEEEVKKAWEKFERDKYEAEIFIQEQDKLMEELNEDLRQSGGRQELFKHPVHLKALSKVADRQEIARAEVEDRLRARGVVRDKGIQEDGR